LTSSFSRIDRRGTAFSSDGRIRIPPYYPRYPTTGDYQYDITFRKPSTAIAARADPALTCNTSG
jgi:hypothetical protein